jgi:hypothetical protein
MEHSSHGCSERVVVRVARCRIVGAAPWSEFLGSGEKRFNCLLSENNQGGWLGGREPGRRASEPGPSPPQPVEPLLFRRLLTGGRQGMVMLYNFPD